MQQAFVVSKWCTDGPHYRLPCIDADYSLEICHDVTGQHPNVALAGDELIVDITAEDAVLAAIASDPKYTILSQQEVADGPFRYV
jgi:hypothetical protein